MLSIDDFKQVKLEDKEFFDIHLKKYPQLHSDYMFTTIISWMHYANYCYNLIEDNLLILTKIEEKLSFRPPIGKPNKNVFQEVIKLAKKEQIRYPIELIDIHTKEWISMNYPKIKCIPNRDFFDYVYLSSDLANLSGSKYAKIRNRLNKFKRNYTYDIELISEDNIIEVNKFLKRWCLWKDCESDELLKNEKKAILYSMENFLELGLSGIIIRLNGIIEAMAVFEKINSDTIVVHYEKASPDYDGIYKAINAETAKMLCNDYTYINRESDMGIPGLRKAKLSYQPHHMVEVFYIDGESLLLM